LFQYHITGTLIFNEKEIVSVSNQHKYGSLQLAKNGKIYVATYKNNPNDLLR